MTPKGTPRSLLRRAACLGMSLSCLLLAEAGWPDEKPAGTPLDLLLTREELRGIAASYVWVEPDVENADELDQVTVKAPVYLAPMRDRSQDVVGGIAAPFWALAHPRDAWRIFVPIPPRPDRK